MSGLRCLSLCLAGTWLLCVAISGQLAARSWTNVTGEFTVEAELVELADGIAVLKRASDGKIIRVPLDRLSAKDRDAALQLAAAEPGGEPVKPPQNNQGVTVAAGLRMPAADGELIHTHASRHAPYVALGEAVYHLPDGKIVGKIPGDAEVEHPPENALSTDGKFHAVCINADNNPVIEVIDTSKGQVSSRIPLAAAGRVSTIWLGFLNEHELGWLGRIGSKPTLCVLDASEGTELRRFNIDRSPVVAALHPNGEKLATARRGELLLIDLATGKTVAQMPLGVDPHNMEFSPDGRELAIKSGENGQTRLTVLDDRGKPIFDHVVPQNPASRSRSRDVLQWAPDRSGWLLGGRYYLDRATKLVVWQLDPIRRGAPNVALVNNDTVLLFQKSPNGTVFVPYAIPRGEITQALAAMTSDKPAALKPGMGVKMQIDVKDVRFGATEEMRTKLEELFQERLEKNGLTIDPNGPLRLHVDYREAVGADTAIVEGFVNRKEIARGKQTEIACVARLLDANGTELWSRTIDLGSSQGGTVSSVKPEDWRRGKLSVLTVEMRRAKVPVYVAGDGSNLRLPVETDLVPN